MEYLFLVGAVHLFVCPYTKVEESFNIQAMHDIIFSKWNIPEYDHLEFPGVVPRTFLGPLGITLIISPVTTLLKTFHSVSSNKFIYQYLVRATLGCCVLLSFKQLLKAVKDIFGEKVAFWFLLITASQYHFMFYLSRPLPNIMVLPIVLLAVTNWLKKNYLCLICYSAIAVIIFRFELAFLLGIIILSEIICGHLSLFRTLKIGTIASLIALITSIAVDSLFWNKLTWPEGEVFWFNVVLNKSSDWGTSPFLWYWYSALPRALGASITLIPAALIGDRRIKSIVLPAVVFIFIMSFLPHKELRFIIYTFPIFNISAAVMCNKMVVLENIGHGKKINFFNDQYSQEPPFTTYYIWSRMPSSDIIFILFRWINKHKSFTKWIASVYVVIHIVINTILTIILLRVASDNYPGGIAIRHLHRLVTTESKAHVYIDNLPAQTGVTKFTEIHADWIYNKTENLSNGNGDYLKFSHLILEARSKYSPNLKPFINSHEILDIVQGFSHIHFNYNTFPPFKVKLKPMIFILKKNIVSNSTINNETRYASLETERDRVKKEEYIEKETGKEFNESENYLLNEVLINESDNFQPPVIKNNEVISEAHYNDSFQKTVYIKNNKDNTSDFEAVIKTDS